MSHGAPSPSHRFTAPTWMLALTGVPALAVPVPAIGRFLTEGWSGTTVVTLALVPLPLLGVVEALGPV